MGLNRFYIGFNGSGYAHASDEYTGTNGQVTSAISYTGYTIDGTPASRGNVSGAIYNEVCKVIGNSAVHNGYYPVYVDLPRGTTPGCGWHSAGTCNGVIVQFAFFWNLDGDVCGDPERYVGTALPRAGSAGERKRTRAFGGAHRPRMEAAGGPPQDLRMLTCAGPLPPFLMLL